MNAQAVIAISGAVVMLIQVLKATGLSGRWAVVTAALLSILGVAVWGYSDASYVRAQTWDYFAGWIAVFTSAAGAFGIINGGAEAVSVVRGAPSALLKSFTSTGNGTSQQGDGK